MFHAADFVSNILLGVDPNSSLGRVVDSLTHCQGYHSHHPAIIFAYDEAHTLTYPLNEWPQDTNFSRFTELRRFIHDSRHLSAFALFLSTTGKVFRLGGVAEKDPSSRVQVGSLKVLHPFSDLSFDLFALDLNQINAMNLEFFADINYIVSLGRPL